MDNIFEAGRGGGGFVIATKVDRTFAEDIHCSPEFLLSRDKISITVCYSCFSIIGVGAVTHGSIYNNVIDNISIGGDTNPSSLRVYNNNFIRPLDATGYGYFVINHSGKPINCSQNYWLGNPWGVTNDGGLTMSKRFLNIQTGATQGFDLSNPLVTPVPMPFKTGIPEIDAIYKPPVKPSSSKPSAWSHLRLPVDFNGTRVGIDYSKYLNPPSFDLQKEVDRVLSEVKSGKGVPPVLDTSNSYHALWKRETYQPIIDGAREAFHKHRDPKTGKPGKKEETITVPGNVTGKDELVVRYYSGSYDNPECIGDDEDIVYFTGETNFMNQLVILPGTILLAASFQNDRNAGAMTPEMIQTLAQAFAETKGAEGPCHKLAGQTRTYLDRLLSLGVIGPLIGKGSIDRPILICSDSSPSAPYSFYRWGFQTGIIDYSMSGDANLGGTNNFRSVVARSNFDNYLSVCKGGPGYLIGCYFGRAWNGNVEVYPGDEAHILFNYLNNPIAPLGTLCLGLPEGGPPMRVAVENNFLCRGGIGSGWPDKSPVIFLSNKDNILQDP